MTRPLDMAEAEHDPDLVADLLAFIEHLKAENARLKRKLQERGRDAS